MKIYFYFIAIVLLSAATATGVNAQGCVAVKNMSTCSMSWDGTSEPHTGWQVSLNYRYFRSYKHFRGRHEETERVENGTEVINNDNSVNLGVTYTFNNRWSASLVVPYIFIDRSSLYEHMGNSSGQRFHTQSAGLGDIRAIGYYNAIPKYPNGGLVLGFGFKLPTGDYKVEDDFHTNDGIVRKYVDQSIQLGDGGVGLIFEVDFIHKLKGDFQGYFNGLYMANPKNTNGVLRSNNPTTTYVTNFPIPLSNEMSVADQYMVRMGGRYTHNALQASLGGRMECIPAKDLIYSSDGFRRPGYVISVEPSVGYTKGAHTFSVNFPIALERRRTRSSIDKARGTDPNTGLLANGDAAFADWLLSATYSCRISK